MCSTQAITPHVPLTFKKAKKKKEKSSLFFVWSKEYFNADRNNLKNH